MATKKRKAKKKPAKRAKKTTRRRSLAAEKTKEPKLGVKASGQNGWMNEATGIKATVKGSQIIIEHNGKTLVGMERNWRNEGKPHDYAKNLARWLFIP